jgi:hypothetical protein
MTSGTQWRIKSPLWGSLYTTVYSNMMKHYHLFFIDISTISWKYKSTRQNQQEICQALENHISLWKISKACDIFWSVWIFSCEQSYCALERELFPSNTFLKHKCFGIRIYKLCNKLDIFKLWTHTWEGAGKMQNRWQLHVRQWNVSLEQKKGSNYTE